MHSATRLKPVRFLIGLALFAVPAFLINGLAKDMIADANKAAGFENIPANAIDIDDSQSLYRAENFEDALSALEEHAGKNPELLEVGVLPYMATFQVKDGQRAKGYRYYAKNRKLGEFKVKLLGPGSLEGSQFPYETISGGVTQKLAAGVAEEGGGLRATNMTIRRGVIDGELEWSVTADSDERTGVVFTANADGSRLGEATQRALERAAAEAE